MKTNTLSYPFELKVSPFTKIIEQKVSQWIDDYDCLDDSLREKYKKSKFGSFSTSFYPDATYDQIVVIARWILAAFAFDDVYGSYPLQQIRVKYNQVLSIMKGEIANCENELFNQFKLVYEDLIGYADPIWMERFIEDHKFWFFGMEQETLYSYKEKPQFPSVREYVTIRERTSGGRLMCDYLEIISDFTIPNDILQDPLIQRIRQLVTFLISWFNDIHSYPWELERNETMNLVLVIYNEEKEESNENIFLAENKEELLKDALEKAIDIHNKDLKEFIKITENIPDFGIYNEKIEKYVHQAKLLLKGQELWYFGGTERYISAQKDLI